MDEIIFALSTLRAPLQQGEYDLHHLVAETLSLHHIAYQHEVSLAPRCRIDFLCGVVGLEIKRGKPPKGQLLRQLARYAACEQVEGLLLVMERTCDLPPLLCGKPLRLISLNRLWGIAL